MHKRTMLSAAAIVAVGCIAIPTGAYATNGGSWLLGRSNSETATTTVTSSAGTPLTLNSGSGTPPLVVNRNIRVTNLNADLLDGLSSGSFARNTAKTGVVNDKNLTDTYGARCPSGTVATGGGGYAPYYGYEIAYSGPDFDTTGAIIPNSWVVFDADGWVGLSYVNCMNMTGGSISGAMTYTDLPSTASSQASGANGVAAEPKHTPGTQKR